MANLSKYSFCRENGEPLAGFHFRKLGPTGRSDYLAGRLLLYVEGALSTT